MTEKQQIEELYNLLAGCHIDQGCTEHTNCDECKAKLLVKEGYQKIPQDSVVLTREEYGAINLERATDMLRAIQEQARKETAKEILQRLYEKFIKYICVGDCYTESDIEKELQELAKQYGVEVE